MEQQDQVQHLGSGRHEHLQNVQAQDGFDKRSKSSGNDVCSKSREQRKAEYANKVRSTQLEVQLCLQNLNQSLNKSLNNSNVYNTFETKTKANKAPEVIFMDPDSSAAWEK